MDRQMDRTMDRQTEWWVDRPINGWTCNIYAKKDNFLIDFAIFTKALPTDQQTNGLTNRRTNGRTYLLIDMRLLHLKMVALNKSKAVLTLALLNASMQKENSYLQRNKDMIVIVEIIAWKTDISIINLSMIYDMISYLLFLGLSISPAIFLQFCSRVDRRAGDVMVGWTGRWR